MGKIIRLTESDLVRLVKKIIKEEPETTNYDMHVGDKAVKYLVNTLKPFGFTFEPAFHFSPDTIHKGEWNSNNFEISLTFDNIMNSDPERYEFELTVIANGKTQINKKYPFTKKDDYAGSNLLKQILNDLGKWKTYNPLKKK
jgi:hypothetical protein